MTAVLTVYEALNKVKTDVGAVHKTDRNSSQGFNFRGIDAVVNASAKPLNDHGVVVAPEVVSYSYETVEIGRNNTKMGHVQLLVKYTFYGPAGDSVSATVFSESMDSGDKAAAKAMSVAFRIALLQVLNLPTDEPDPDESSYERSSGETIKTVSRGKVNATPHVVVTPDMDWLKAINDAETIGVLRGVWSAAGEAGALQDKITVTAGGNASVFTVQDLLIRRNDELKVSKSS